MIQLRKNSSEYLNSVKGNGVKARQNPRLSLTGMRRPDRLPQLISIFPTINFKITKYIKHPRISRHRQDK